MCTRLKSCIEFTNPSGPQSVTDPLINPQITVRSNVSNPVQVILNGQTLDYSADQPSCNQDRHDNEDGYLLGVKVAQTVLKKIAQ